MIPIWLDRYGLYEFTNCFYNKNTDQIETKIEDSLDLPSFTTDFMIAPTAFEFWSHFDYKTNGNVVIKYRTSETEQWKDVNPAPVIREMCINKISTKYIDLKYPVKQGYSIRKKKYYECFVKDSDKKYDVEFYSGKCDSNRMYYNTYDYTKMLPGTTQIVIYTPDVHWLHLTDNYIQFKIYIASVNSNLEIIKGWDTGTYDLDTYYDGGYDPDTTIYIKDLCVMVEDNNITNAEQYLPGYFGWY